MALRIEAWLGVERGGEQRKSNWFTENTNNSLRIARILKCLSILGLAIQAKAVQKRLLDLYGCEPDFGVDKSALQFWRETLSAFFYAINSRCGQFFGIVLLQSEN
jgi:hypothetical protein